MKPKHRKPLAAIALAAIASTASSANAAITYFGTLTNDLGGQISAWSSSSVIKTRDIGTDNRYGTDGYTWMSNNNDGGANPNALNAITQSIPSYTGGIAYTGAAGRQVSGSFSGADDRLNPDGTGSSNVGYAGVNYNGTTGATNLQQMFVYTMNRSMRADETIRLGVILDSFNDRSIIGADFLQVAAGGFSANAVLAGNRNAVMDMYFFDITGLSSGQQIQILGAKAVDQSDFGFNAITISGVTFDSIPETSAALLGGLGMLALLRRRSR